MASFFSRNGTSPLSQIADYRALQKELRDQAAENPASAPELNAKIAEIDLWIRGCERVLRQI